jgi:hypothetical protein
MPETRSKRKANSVSSNPEDKKPLKRPKFEPSPPNEEAPASSKTKKRVPSSEPGPSAQPEGELPKQENPSLTCRKSRTKPKSVPNQLPPLVEAALNKPDAPNSIPFVPSEPTNPQQNMSGRPGAGNPEDDKVILNQSAFLRSHIKLTFCHDLWSFQDQPFGRDFSSASRFVRSASHNFFTAMNAC